MQRYIFKRSGLDSGGGGSPISYPEVTGSAAQIRKAGVRISQVSTTFVCTVLNSIPVEVEFLA